MSSWLPPSDLGTSATGQASAAPSDRRAIWGGVGKAVLGATVLTIGIVYVGATILAAASGPTDGDSDSGNGLAFIAWAIFSVVCLGPVCTWALLTYQWRTLIGPTRPVRIVAALTLLLPALLIRPTIIELFLWTPDGAVERRIVDGGVALAVGVGALLTGRVLSARHAAAAAAVVTTAGLAIAVASVA